MKIILWGLVVFVVAALGWVCAIVFTVITGGHFKGVANSLGVAAFVGIPVAVVLAVIGRITKGKK